MKCFPAIVTAFLLLSLALVGNAASPYVTDTTFMGIVQRADKCFNSFEYQTADSLYNDYLLNKIEREGLSLDNCYISANKETLGRALYNYAYNSFFMGNPGKGLYLLSLSDKCGNIWAKQDYAILSDCENSMAGINISGRIISQYRWILENHDYEFQTDSVKNNDIAKNFWENFTLSNNSVRELQIVLSQKKRPRVLTNAMYDILAAQDNISDRLKNECRPFKTGSTESDLISALGGGTSELRELRIYPAEEINAFATPYAQIYLTTGIVYRYHSMHALLLGVCAHEMTHIMGHHSLIELWKRYRKERKAKIAAGIVSGLYATSMAAASIYSASNGVSNYTYNNSIATSASNLYRAIAGSSLYFQFKYSREQELEADLIAYRFCEAIGMGGYAYIMSLQLLAEDDLYLKHDKTDDHPTLAYRIAFLKWLYQKEHGTVDLMGHR